MKDCSFENSTEVLSYWQGTSNVTFNFKGINDMGVAELPADSNLKYNGVQAGTKVYPSFSGAYAAAADGDTVKLLGNLALEETLTVDKDLTLDLNGKTVTANADVYPVIRVQGDADLTV